jgi:hypothetical protein
MMVGIKVVNAYSVMLIRNWFTALRHQPSARVLRLRATTHWMSVFQSKKPRLTSFQENFSSGL